MLHFVLTTPRSRVVTPLLAFSLAVSASVLSAQNSPNAANNRTADQEWDDIARVASPAPLPGGERRTTAQVKTELTQRAAKARQGAAAAKDFYVRNPTHLRAAEAQKLEALLSLQGVADDAPAHEAQAQQIARAYRQDAKQPAADRFEVALLSERVQSRAKLHGNPHGNEPAELEKIADKLLTEFNNSAEAFYF